MVDGERKPPMGYIYEAMDRAKETIAKSFGMKEEHYGQAPELIDKRWNCQLHRPLHAAGYFLNPEIYYENPEQVGCQEVQQGLYDCAMRLIPDIATQDKAMHELDAYKNAEGLFGHPMALRHRKTKAPVVWWSCYGSSAPNLKNFAIKLHTKRRSRLDQAKLNDMVYVKYNHSLQRRYKRRDSIDPIMLDDIDESNEWLVGKMDKNSSSDEELVFDDDDLTWSTVSKATGANDPIYATRRASRAIKDVTRASKSKVDKGKGVATSSRGVVVLDDEEDEVEEDIGQDGDYLADEDEYNGDDDDFDDMIDN